MDQAPSSSAEGRATLSLHRSSRAISQRPVKARAVETPEATMKKARAPNSELATTMAPLI